MDLKDLFAVRPEEYMWLHWAQAAPGASYYMTTALNKYLRDLQAPAVLEGRDSDVLNISLLPQTSDLFTQIATLTQFFVINKSRPQSLTMVIPNSSALCKDAFHSSRQVQLHSCSYLCLKGKVSSQQDLGRLRATETQHPRPTDCSAGLNPEPITGKGSCSCP